MKRLKTGILIISFALIAINIWAQTEPEFIGRVNYLNKSQAKELEMQTAQVSSKVGAGMALSALFNKGKAWAGKAHEYHSFTGIKSPVRISNRDGVQFIINLGNNNLEPTTRIVVLKLKWDPTKDTRYFEYVSQAKVDQTISLVGFPQEVAIPFNVKKFALQSYLLTLNNLAPGEYAIYSKNETMSYYSLFGID